MNREAEAATITASPAPPAHADRSRWPWWAGLLTGLLLAALVGTPLLYIAYRNGKERGREVEREHAFQIEQPVIVPAGEWPTESRLAPAPPSSTPTPEKAGDLVIGPSGEAKAAAGTLLRPITRSPDGPIPAAPAAWCFSANECVRAVWPMELLPKSNTVDHPHFRVREGVNRLTGLDNGLCEFVFRLDEEASVGIYFHVCYWDACGNSFRCYVDGGPAFPFGGTKVYGRWLWERSMRRFTLRPGLHRLTVQTREDGLELDRVVIAGPLFLYADLDALPVTPPPVFESMPPAAPNLPAIGAVTAQMFASDSMVVGAGHRNTLTVFLHLNGPEAAAGNVELQSAAAGYFEQREFRLTPAERTCLLSWDITLRPRFGYFVPLRMRVMLPSGCVHQQALNFIRPLAWAFLGPIPDPEGKGLDFVPAPERQIEALPSLPPFPGLEWKVVEDGSCYNEFGVVDFNKVFGLPNEGWHEDITDRPAVAYAVTVIAFFGDNHHLPLVIAGDDCVQAWLNGKLWLRQNGNAPLETTRMVVGTDMAHGRSTFVFKIPQTRCYWQLLFEPENTLPYSFAHAFQALPSVMWKQFSRPRIGFPP